MRKEIEKNPILNEVRILPDFCGPGFECRNNLTITNLKKNHQKNAIISYYPIFCKDVGHYNHIFIKHLWTASYRNKFKKVYSEHCKLTFIEQNMHLSTKMGFDPYLLDIWSKLFSMAPLFIECPSSYWGKDIERFLQ